MNEAIIEVKNLTKHFAKVQAVNGVSFQIPAGKCFGLLGPNGAGKTTTIEIMEGITEATSGEILFRGQDRGAQFREKIGIQFQATSLMDFLTVREVLNLFKNFYTHTVPIEDLAKLCALEEFWDRDTHKLSGGQRQRVLLAIALVNDPEIIFLDEPTTGLDPQARRNFWTLIRTIKAKNKTVVLTTHYMEEAYELCDEIAIMDRGKIIAQGAPDQLLKDHFTQVSLELPMTDMTLTELPAGWIKNETEGRYQTHTPNVNESLKILMEKGISLNRLNIRRHTLEDLFLELTGKQMRA